MLWNGKKGLNYVELLNVFIEEAPYKFFFYESHINFRKVKFVF